MYNFILFVKYRLNNIILFFFILNFFYNFKFKKNDYNLFHQEYQYLLLREINSYYLLNFYDIYVL